MKKVDTEKAVGMVLAHDITRIIPGQFKGVGFKKGHIVQQEDIPELLKLGKQSLYVLDLSENEMHEDEAALKIAEAICGNHLYWSDPSEGKSNIISKSSGLLKIHADGLLEINKLGSIIISSLKNNFPCNKDQIVAATRIIPLTIEREKIKRLEAIAASGAPIISIVPFQPARVGAVVTGSEIHDGLIKDGFDAFVGKKIEAYDSVVEKKILTPDDPDKIASAILELAETDCDLIVTTGGLSVDPDDVTRMGIQKAGADIIVYGAPVLPGAMFLYARIKDKPILGLPACVYYHATTIFDLMFPRILAGESITTDEIAAMGHGGLCMNCDVCRFPVCPFGK